MEYLNLPTGFGVSCGDGPLGKFGDQTDIRGYTNRIRLISFETEIILTTQGAS